MNHRFSAYAHAALSLIGVSSFFRGAAKADFDWLLRTQTGLAALPGDQLATTEMECRANTATHLSNLRKKTLVSLAFVISAIALALTMFVLPAVGSQGLTRPHMFAIASVGSFSWGTLGRLGWTERSYKGVTVFEELDAAIFWLLYWLGSFCGVASVVSAAA